MKSLLTSTQKLKTDKEVLEGRVTSFEEMYFKVFKEEVTLKDAFETEDESFSLNFYGVKSNWM